MTRNQKLTYTKIYLVQIIKQVYLSTEPIAF